MNKGYIEITTRYIASKPHCFMLSYPPPSLLPCPLECD